MNYSNYLLSIANDIVSQMPESRKIKSVLLTGSATKKIADKYSNIELIILWEESPTSDERRHLFSTIDKKVNYEDVFEDKEWYSSFFYRSVKVDIAQFDFPTLNSFIQDVFVRFDTSINKQLLFSAIKDGSILKGEKLTDIHMQLTHYPDELAKRCIKINALFESWNLREVFVFRNDFIAMHNLINNSVKQILRLLFATNKQLLRNYNFKWIDYQLSFLTVKPNHLKKRLEKVCTVEFQIAISELYELIKEVYYLVTQKYPELDLSFEYQSLKYKREGLLLK